MLRIKKYYSIVAHSPDVVELRHGVWNPTSFTLTDDSKSGHLFRILERLDGSTTPAVLARELNVPRNEIEDLIDHLNEKGLLEDGPTNSIDYYLENCVPSCGMGNAGSIPSVLLLGSSSLTHDIHRLLVPSLPDASISIVAERDEKLMELWNGDDAWLHDAEAYQRKVLPFDEWKKSFIVMVQSIINPLHFTAINRVCLEYRIPWMHVALDGPFLLIGPIIVPFRSACYNCLETRVIMNMRQDASYQSYKAALARRELQVGSIPIEAVICNMVASHAGLEIVNFLQTGYSATVGKILSIFLPTMEFSYSDVLRVPGCNACGSTSERDEKELYFDIRTLLQDNISYKGEAKV